jgi:hypothetical protein
MLILETDSQLNTQNTAISWPLRLWASVLRRAIVDWVLYNDHADPKLRQMGKDAEEWLFFEGSDEDMSSFSSVCSIMGLPQSLMRQKIRSMTEEHARRLRGMEFGDDC